MATLDTVYAVDAVFFDWDLTLAAILGDVPPEERYSLLLRSHGFPYSPAEVGQAMEERQGRVARGEWPGEEQAQSHDQWVLFYRQLLSLLGATGVPPGAPEELFRGYSGLPWRLYPDTLPALRELSRRGFRLGVITNAAVHIRPVIEQLLGHLVPPGHLAISDELAVSKPQPGIFIAAAALAGVPAGRCLFVGDNPSVDTQAALAAGFGRALWIDRQGGTAGVDHLQRITGLGQVLNFVGE